MPYLVLTADELVDQFAETTKMVGGSSLAEALNTAEATGWRLLTVAVARDQETFYLHKAPGESSPAAP